MKRQGRKDLERRGKTGKYEGRGRKERKGRRERRKEGKGEEGEER